MIKVVKQELVQNLISKKVKLKQNMVRKIHQQRKKSPTCLFEIEKEELLSHQTDMLKQISFALTVAEEINEIVPRTYEEVMNSKNKDL